jgi:hypothetical protein
MPSEALRNIRTMRQVKSSLDIARHQKPRTTNSLSKSEGETAHLLSLTDPRVNQLLAKEMKHFGAMEASMDRSRGRILKARDKLATTINKNRALNELRLELQRSRLEGKNPTPEKAPIQAEVKAQPKLPTRKPRKQKLRQVELKY